MIGNVRKIIVIKPGASEREIESALREKNINISRQYIRGLLKKIHGERAWRYNNVAAKMAIAQFEDFVKFVASELIKIRTTTKSDMVKVIALDNMIKHYRSLIDLQFDMGVFERKLGTIRTEVVNIAELLKLLKDAEQEQKRDTGHIGEIESKP